MQLALLGCAVYVHIANSTKAMESLHFSHCIARETSFWNLVCILKLNQKWWFDALGTGFHPFKQKDSLASKVASHVHPETDRVYAAQ
jgi:hypothetical protein